MAAVFLPDELSAATGGKWLSDLTPAGALAITTDTRCDNKGRIFFALAGERFDAHDFLMQAVDSGCEALCINRNREVSLPANIPVLTVDDTLKAMQNCAAMHRQRFAGLQVFGVTGSVGKTSVKEMLRAICSCASSADKVLYTLFLKLFQWRILRSQDNCLRFFIIRIYILSRTKINNLVIFH